jgi:hypothetical protein
VDSGIIFDLPFESRWHAAGGCWAWRSPASARSAAMPEAGPGRPSRKLVLAFDIGLRRIGVACGDTLSRSGLAAAG